MIFNIYSKKTWNFCLILFLSFFLPSSPSFLVCLFSLSFCFLFDCFAGGQNDSVPLDKFDMNTFFDFYKHLIERKEVVKIFETV